MTKMEILERLLRCHQTMMEAMTTAFNKLYDALLGDLNDELTTEDQNEQDEK
nr:MAG TPA: hypothetical protein [Caudoviricetes sp.]